MKVKELKEALEQYPDDATVVIPFTTDKRAQVEVEAIDMDDYQSPETNETIQSVLLYSYVQ